MRPGHSCRSPRSWTIQRVMGRSLRRYWTSCHWRQLGAQVIHGKSKDATLFIPQATKHVIPLTPGYATRSVPRFISLLRLQNQVTFLYMHIAVTPSFFLWNMRSQLSLESRFTVLFACGRNPQRKSPWSWRLQVFSPNTPATLAAGSPAPGPLDAIRG